MTVYTGTRFLRYALLAVIIGMLSGCASMITEGLARDLQVGIANQNDPAIVRAGAPAYMLIIDGNIQGNPNNRAMLMAGACL